MACLVKANFLQNDDLASLLIPDAEAALTATKVVITIGPACQDVDTLCAMLNAGATCARCDLTWGSIEYHRRSLANLAAAQARTRKLCAVMLDTTGREITVDRGAAVTCPDPGGWPVHAAPPVEVKAGDRVTLVCSPDAGASLPVTPTAGGPIELAVSYAGLPAMAQVGDTIFVGRYLATGAEETSLYLTVDAVEGDRISGTSGNAASLEGLLTIFHTERSADGVANLQNDLPVLCADDCAALAALASDYEVDYVSLSFTRSAADVRAAREWMDAVPGLASTRILAKLETRQALFAFEEVAAAADGVILSRGNLGLDVLPEKMALVQKAVVGACNRMGKPALMTRVVDTMVAAPRPTRAEATDVANAVLDGVDAILLGAETLRGRQPAATVATVLAIARQAELVFDANAHFEKLMREAVAAEDDAAYRAVAGCSSSALDRAGSVDDVHLLASQARGSTGRLAGRGGCGGGGGGGPLPHLNGSAAPGGGAPPTASAASLAAAVSSMSLGRSMVSGGNGAAGGAPVLSKLESMASSAVRAAEKVGATLIVVYTQSGAAASLVSKYRPPVPIVALVIPRLASDGMSWRLEGRAVARQALVQRGLLPVLAAPAPSGEALLEEAVAMAAAHRLVGPGDHVVTLQMVRGAFAIKIVTLDESGRSIAQIRPRSLVDLVRHTAGGMGGCGSSDGGAGGAGAGAGPPDVRIGADGCGYAGPAAAGTHHPHLAGAPVSSSADAGVQAGGPLVACPSDVRAVARAAGM